MITNFTSVSFKHWDPDDYVEITGKLPNYTFYERDSSGNINTDCFEDSIKKYKDARKTPSEKEVRSHANYALAKVREGLSKVEKMNPSQVARKINLHA